MAAPAGAAYAFRPRFIRGADDLNGHETMAGDSRGSRFARRGAALEAAAAERVAEAAARAASQAAEQTARLARAQLRAGPSSAHVAGAFPALVSAMSSASASAAPVPRAVSGSCKPACAAGGTNHHAGLLDGSADHPQAPVLSSSSAGAGEAEQDAAAAGGKALAAQQRAARLQRIAADKRVQAKQLVTPPVCG